MLSRGVVPLAPGCGGAELVALELARSLAAAGHDVTLLADGDVPAVPRLRVVPVSGDLAQHTAHVPGRFPKLLAAHLAGNIDVVAAARRLTQAERFDFIHAHGSLSAILTSLVCDVPVVYTEHDAPPWLCRYRVWWERALRTAIYRALNVTAFHCADAVGATFSALRDDMVARFEVSGTKVRTIVNAADVAAFAPGAGVDPPAVPFDRFALFVGKLESRKAPDLLLRALAQTPGVNLVFAGDGPMRGALERLVEELELSGRVTFLGSLPPARLPRLYERADLVVLPSVSEAMPLVAIEALACGTPVLATRIAGIPAVVEDWETGFLVAPGEVGELAVALRFLMLDDDLRHRMGATGGARVRERFAWPSVAGEYELLYRSLDREPAPPVTALHPVPAYA
jgi:glycosyltransferase involved in cell wall biosynthesis